MYINHTYSARYFWTKHLDRGLLTSDFQNTLYVTAVSSTVQYKVSPHYWQDYILDLYHILLKILYEYRVFMHVYYMYR